MRWKSTAVLLLATIAVGAYISLYELRQPDPEERHRLAARVLDVPEAAARITLAWPGRPDVVFTRAGDAWRLEPGGWRTDPALVQGLLGALRLYASRSFTPGPSQSLAEFGLEPPTGQITVGDATLLIGGLTPVAGGRYVKRADQAEVHVVDARVIEAADHPTEDFRDRALLRVEPWEVVHVAWTDGAQRLTLSREGNDWWLTDTATPATARPGSDEGRAGEPGAPHEVRGGAGVPARDGAPADDEAVLRWLTQWSSLPIAAFLNDAAQPADLASAGIHETAPRLALTLDGGRTLTVTIGGPVPATEPGAPRSARGGEEVPASDGGPAHPELRYAARSDEPASLYGVADADVEALKKSPEELRKKEEPPATEAAEAADGSPDALQRGGTEEPSS